MKRFLVIAVALAAVAAVAYLATLGCCQWMESSRRSAAFTDRLSLTPDQRQAIAPLEKQFIARKEASCAVLCAKRAQLIQLLRNADSDRAAMAQLTEEIGREQTALEKATLDYLVAVGGHLEPAQRERLVASGSEELRTACKATDCSKAGSCFMVKDGDPT